MHVKYKQDNLHRMTWYTGTCGSNGHGLSIHSNLLWIHWFRAHDATIHNGTVTIGRTSLVSVGHTGLDPIMPLMLRTVCSRAMVEALALYYRSLETASTLLKSGKISSRL